MLAAGVLEFVERGYAAVSVTDIAKRAGMTPAAVYYHFPAKEDILLALVTRAGDAVLELCSQPADSPLAEEAAPALVDRFLAWLDAHPAEARLYYLSSEGSTAEVEALRRDQRRRQVKAMLDGPIRPAKGSMTATELKVVALAVLVLFGEVTRILTERRYTRRTCDRVRAEAHDLARRLVKPA